MVVSSQFILGDALTVVGRGDLGRKVSLAFSSSERRVRPTPLRRVTASKDGMKPRCGAMRMRVSCHRQNKRTRDTLA